MSRASIELGKRIRQAREKRGLNQLGLGLLLCLSQSAISRYERGVRIPDAILLKEMAKILNCSVDSLLGL